MCRTPQLDFRVLGGAAIAVAVAAVSSSCASGVTRSPFAAYAEPEVAAHNSVVILRVINREWYDVAVLLDGGNGLQRRVGTVPGAQWSFFVLTNTVLGAIKDFAVVLFPVGQAGMAHHSNRIMCVPGDLLFLTITVGEGPAPAPQQRVNVIASSLP